MISFRIQSNLCLTHPCLLVFLNGKYGKNNTSTVGPNAFFVLFSGDEERTTYIDTACIMKHWTVWKFSITSFRLSDYRVESRVEIKEVN